MFTRELSMRAPMWWGFSVTNSWTLLIDPAKNIEHLSGQEHRHGAGRKSLDVRISIPI